jgi:CDP-glucose 4,6-dehydratase
MSVRPWQHVLEPLAGYLILAERLTAPDGSRYAEEWNFGPADEDCRSVIDVVAALGREWGQSAHWRLATGPQPGESILLKVDASKARSFLEWHQRLRFEDAAAWTGEWYRAEFGGADPVQLCHEQISRYEAFASAGA